MGYRQALVIGAFLAGLMTYRLVSAQLEPTPGTQNNDIPLVDNVYEQKLDETHEKASQVVVTTAGWIDSFFDDERYALEENRTRAKLRLSVGYSRYEHFDFSPRVNLRLKLPQLSKKAFLIIGASDDDDFDVNRNPTEDQPANEDTEKSDLSASLRYFLKVGKQYHLSTMAGVSFSYLYAGLRYRYVHDFGSWEGRFSSTVKWYTDDGWENKSTIDMERYISTKWFFRTSANLAWYENEKGIPHSLIFNLYQVIDEHRALLYEVGNYFDTEPSHKMTDVQLGIRYRQRFYRDWLVFEIAPQIGFPEEHDRKPNPGIVFKLEADFGYLADEEMFHKIFGF